MYYFLKSFFLSRYNYTLTQLPFFSFKIQLYFYSVICKMRNFVLIQNRYVTTRSPCNMFKTTNNKVPLAT